MDGCVGGVYVSKTRVVFKMIPTTVQYDTRVGETTRIPYGTVHVRTHKRTKETLMPQEEQEWVGGWVGRKSMDVVLERYVHLSLLLSTEESSCAAKPRRTAVSCRFRC